MVGDLPGQLRLQKATLEQGDEIEAARAQKVEREDGAVAVLGKPGDLVVEVLLTG